MRSNTAEPWLSTMHSASAATEAELAAQLPELRSLRVAPVQPAAAQNAHPVVQRGRDQGMGEGKSHVPTSTHSFDQLRPARTFQGLDQVLFAQPLP